MAEETSGALFRIFQMAEPEAEEPGAVQVSPLAAATEVLHAPAPTLEAEGETLKWSKVESYTSYIVVRKIAEVKGSKKWVVNALTYKPETLPGITANYKVRANVKGSRFSKPLVYITYEGENTEPPINTEIPKVTVES